MNTYNQKQHIIPEVYLKQFGYRDKGGIWKVPTFNVHEIGLMNQIDKTLIRQSNIKSLLQEENIYDIPEIQENRRLLENFLKLTEDSYPQVIAALKLNQRISDNQRSMLLGFISLLFTRSLDYRFILHSVLENRDMVYLNRIMDGNQTRINYLMSLPPESAINFLIAFSGGFVFKAMMNFKIAIIKNCPIEKWATTDNPVTIICKADMERRLDFMGIDTKILFPMSPEYLAYVDHVDSKVILNKDLERLKENCVNEIPQDVYKGMWLQITDRTRITKYLILPS